MILVHASLVMFLPEAVVLGRDSRADGVVESKEAQEKRSEGKVLWDRHSDQQVSCRALLIAVTIPKARFHRSRVACIIASNTLVGCSRGAGRSMT